jgi:hypothetical protein
LTGFQFYVELEGNEQKKKKGKSKKEKLLKGKILKE